MSLDLTTLIESAADEVASAGRAAAGSINTFVADVAERVPALPGRSRRKSRTSLVRLLLPMAVLAVVAVVLFKKRQSLTPHLPQRLRAQDEMQESVVASANGGKRAAEGAAAS